MIQLADILSSLFPSLSQGAATGVSTDTATAIPFSDVLDTAETEIQAGESPALFGIGNGIEEGSESLPLPIATQPQHKHPNPELLQAAGDVSIADDVADTALLLDAEPETVRASIFDAETLVPAYDGTEQVVRMNDGELTVTPYSPPAPEAPVLRNDYTEFMNVMNTRNAVANDGVMFQSQPVVQSLFEPHHFAAFASTQQSIQHATPQEIHVAGNDGKRVETPLQQQVHVTVHSDADSLLLRATMPVAIPVVAPSEPSPEQLAENISPDTVELHPQVRQALSVLLHEAAAASTATVLPPVIGSVSAKPASKHTSNSTDVVTAPVVGITVMTTIPDTDEASVATVLNAVRDAVVATPGFTNAVVNIELTTVPAEHTKDGGINQNDNEEVTAESDSQEHEITKNGTSLINPPMIQSIRLDAPAQILPTQIINVPVLTVQQPSAKQEQHVSANDTVVRSTATVQNSDTTRAVAESTVAIDSNLPDGTLPEIQTQTPVQFQPDIPEAETVLNGANPQRSLFGGEHISVALKPIATAFATLIDSANSLGLNVKEAEIHLPVSEHTDGHTPQYHVKDAALDGELPVHQQEVQPTVNHTSLSAVVEVHNNPTGTLTQPAPVTTERTDTVPLPTEDKRVVYSVDAQDSTDVLVTSAQRHEPLRQSASTLTESPVEIAVGDNQPVVKYEQHEVNAANTSVAAPVKNVVTLPAEDEPQSQVKLSAVKLTETNIETTSVSAETGALPLHNERNSEYTRQGVSAATQYNTIDAKKPVAVTKNDVAPFLRTDTVHGTTQSMIASANNVKENVSNTTPSLFNDVLRPVQTDSAVLDNGIGKSDAYAAPSESVVDNDAVKQAVSVPLPGSTQSKNEKTLAQSVITSAPINEASVFNNEVHRSETLVNDIEQAQPTSRQTQNKNTIQQSAIHTESLNTTDIKLSPALKDLAEPVAGQKTEIRVQEPALQHETAETNIEQNTIAQQTKVAITPRYEMLDSSVAYQEDSITPDAKNQTHVSLKTSPDGAFKSSAIPDTNDKPQTEAVQQSFQQQPVHRVQEMRSRSELFSTMMSVAPKQPEVQQRASTLQTVVMPSQTPAHQSTAVRHIMNAVASLRVAVQPSETPQPVPLRIVSNEASTALGNKAVQTASQAVDGVSAGDAIATSGVEPAPTKQPALQSEPLNAEPMQSRTKGITGTDEAIARHDTSVDAKGTVIPLRTVIYHQPLREELYPVPTHVPTIDTGNQNETASLNALTDSRITGLSPRENTLLQRKSNHDANNHDVNQDTVKQEMLSQPEREYVVHSTAQVTKKSINDIEQPKPIRPNNTVVLSNSTNRTMAQQTHAPRVEIAPSITVKNTATAVKNVEAITTDDVKSAQPLQAASTLQTHLQSGRIQTAVLAAEAAGLAARVSRKENPQVQESGDVSDDDLLHTEESTERDRAVVNQTAYQFPDNTGQQQNGNGSPDAQTHMNEHNTTMSHSSMTALDGTQYQHPNRIFGFAGAEPRSLQNHNIEQHFADMPVVRTTVESFAATTSVVVRNMPAQTGGSARLVLNPESLGTVVVNLRVGEHENLLHIEVESHETRTMVEAQLPLLREQLTQSGIRMEALSVSVKPNEQQQQQTAPAQQSGFTGNNGTGNGANQQQRSDDRESRAAYLRSVNDDSNPRRNSDGDPHQRDRQQREQRRRMAENVFERYA
ncbi:MAG: flagellar hook-length control protein FliK [Candidatus Kapabacteria bacterium]|nr:flagellar hook-length control protein FliK [Candidatus Kapabacteria bacterium]